MTGYPLPEAIGLAPNAVFPAAVLSTGLRVRIGRLDGQPCAVGLSLVARGVTNLCLAATLDAGRRRGLWQALALARMADALELPAVACTSDYSRPGFEKLGFLPVSRFTLWLRLTRSSRSADPRRRAAGPDAVRGVGRGAVRSCSGRAM
ncbi:MAG: hypothetical protein JJD92_00055 [Frankiaceae bacterium]|nr:hypothetical protein [Frankiaceae bacterium]